MPRIKGKVYEDDPFCRHGYDEGCPECDATPSQLAAGEAAPSVDRLRKPIKQVSKVMDEAEYRRFRDRLGPPKDNYRGW